MNISTKVFGLSLVIIFILVFGWRYIYRIALAGRMFTVPIAILGTGELASEIGAEITEKIESGYNIVCFIGEVNDQWQLPADIPVIADPNELVALAAENRIERIVVALENRRGFTPIDQLLHCKLEGVPISKGVGFYESLTGKILVTKVTPAWLIYTSGFKKSRLSCFSKRLVDVLIAITGLIFSFPLTILSAIIIKLETPGGIFYTQERVGEGGKPFNVVKFRSMGCDAEKDGPVWALQNDTRVTRYGAIMRKTRIDEIPQMWNVLKGEMSFVGPRPERPIFVEKLEKVIPYFALRHTVKPGLTGWAQVSYPYGASEEDALRKLEYDLYYIKHLTVFMDLKIIFQTIKTVLFQKGGR